MTISAAFAALKPCAQVSEPTSGTQRPNRVNRAEHQRPEVDPAVALPIPQSKPGPARMTPEARPAVVSRSPPPGTSLRTGLGGRRKR